MANGGTVAETDEGVLKFLTDELRVISKPRPDGRTDASAVRLGAPPAQRALGKIAADIHTVQQDGKDHHEEVALIIFKQTEDANNQLGSKGGEVLFMAKERHTGSTDDAMTAVFSYDSRGVYFHVPVHGAAINGSAGSAPAGRYYHEGWTDAVGGFVTIYQADGHVVQYDARNKPETFGPADAVWSNWHGLLRPLPW